MADAVGDEIGSAAETAAAPAAAGSWGMLPATLALAACGGGGGGAAPAPSAGSGGSTPVVVVPAVPTQQQASRFLGQATMGATRAEIDAVVAKGFEGWLNEQFALPREVKHWDWLVNAGFNVATNKDNTAGFDAVMWRQMIAAPDQLRQRVGMALLDILVVGIDGINLNWKQFAMAAYVDVLLDGAFGNYRDLMEAVTTNAAMASFLTYLNNRKADTRTGALPDENYARELMQLFTLGVHQLNMDGTVKGGGSPIDTYSQADVSQLARVFTGLTLASADSSTPDRYRLPLVVNAGQNEAGGSTVLGVGVGGGGMVAVKSALDVIFQHPNLPPFVSKQLIQRLVTSNPSPAYVGRVAQRFVDNGSGVRGDLKAVVRAILTDQEALGSASLTAQSSGKLREPVLRLTGWARAFGVSSPSGAWSFGDTSNPSNRLGQAKGRSQSVFNFYRPGYAPPATAISASGLVAPEFQITNEQSVVGYVNYMHGLVANGAGDAKADYTAMVAKADNSESLVGEVNLLLAAGQLSAATVGSIRAAVDSVALTATNGAINRVGIAILLTLASPDYLLQR
ncbi:uncharacterized protein (DUF1800 family) [Sphingomonas jejuensis]|uniref:Uncharacterized protein (DUF1800 family) n=1 Tax=Sphingomonas jejuensis TaxID=904715 RepID=A0ABX0XQS6_9SPHN|nr:uncharacterized protein (DUF1800 family) [Sphingomonas jejuensis]